MTQHSAANPIRPPAVAGLFYPGGSEALAVAVDDLLGAAESTAAANAKAIIAPHAGYEYSGPVAANVYALLRPQGGVVQRVVLMGPAHRIYFDGLALPDAGSFRTPLGDVALDRGAVASLLGLRHVKVLNEAHDREHSLEVHLPFLQRVLGDFALVPVAIGVADPADVEEALELLWGGPETLIVVSSDLSHYEPYRNARVHDAATAAAIERFDGRALGPDDACGCIAVSGLLAAAKRRGLTCARIDLRNSGDTAGGRSEVVGYGAWVFAEQT